MAIDGSQDGGSCHNFPIHVFWLVLRKPAAFSRKIHGHKNTIYELSRFRIKYRRSTKQNLVATTLSRLEAKVC